MHVWYSNDPGDPNLLIDTIIIIVLQHGDRSVASDYRHLEKPKIASGKKQPKVFLLSSSL